MDANDDKCLDCYAKAVCNQRDFRVVTEEKTFGKPLKKGGDNFRLTSTKHECDKIRLAFRKAKKKRVPHPTLFDLTPTAEEEHGS